MVYDKFGMLEGLRWKVAATAAEKPAEDGTDAVGPASSLLLSTRSTGSGPAYREAKNDEMHPISAAVVLGTPSSRPWVDNRAEHGHPSCPGDSVASPPPPSNQPSPSPASSLKDITLEVESAAMETPYRTLAASMLVRLWVIIRNWLLSVRL